MNIRGLPQFSKATVYTLSSEANQGWGRFFIFFEQINVHFSPSVCEKRYPFDSVNIPVFCHILILVCRV